jgi:hypothetical protein
MAQRRVVLLVALPLAAGACAQVLGLDEPTVKSEGVGGASAANAGPQTGATGGGASSASTSGAGGGGGNGGDASTTAGSGGRGPCESHAACDDANPCTIDVCSEGACVNEASETQPEDALDDCVDVTCAGDVPTVTPDDTEDAADPSPPCLTAVCEGGVPKPVHAAAGTSCGAPPLACDGEGSCVGCSSDGDCAVGGPCATAACGADGVCDVTLLEQGTVVPDEEGNCAAATCTGQSPQPTPTYDPDDLPPPMTCAEIECAPGGPRVREANDGVPCTVGDFEGVCSGNGTGDGACVQCEDQNDCELQPAGGRCNNGSGVCGCSFGGDCQGYWRDGSSCLDGAGADDVCGCSVASHCTGNMHGHVCVGERCGCLDDGDCAGAELGSSCSAVTQTCGCAVDADCTGSDLGSDCLPDGRCGCDAEADCGIGQDCQQPFGFCY